MDKCIFSVFLIVFAVAINAPSAYAQFFPNAILEKIPEGTELILLGGGITPRNAAGMATIFFSCVGKVVPCATVRAVSVNYAGEAKWMGISLELLSAEELASVHTQNEIDHLIKKKMKYYRKKFHHEYDRGAKIGGKVLLWSILAAVVLMIPLSFTVPVVVTAVSNTIAFGGLGTAVFMASNTTTFGTAGKYGHALQNKNGWNWSTKVKKISSEVFYEFEQYIMKGYPID